MLISQVVEKLAKILYEHGDLPVYGAEIDGGGYGEIEIGQVRFAKSEKRWWANPNNLPDYPDRAEITL
jgi:hypothetical protein